MQPVKVQRESSAVTEYLAHKQRLWDELLKHWRRMTRAVESLAAEDPVLGLEVALLVEQEGDELVEHMVLRMREDGASWDDVAAVFGVTRSSAHRRWRHVDDERVQAPKVGG